MWWCLRVPNYERYAMPVFGVRLCYDQSSKRNAVIGASIVGQVSLVKRCRVRSLDCALVSTAMIMECCVEVF